MIMAGLFDGIEAGDEIARLASEVSRLSAERDAYRSLAGLWAWAAIYHARWKLDPEVADWLFDHYDGTPFTIANFERVTRQAMSVVGKPPGQDRTVDAEAEWAFARRKEMSR